MGTLEQVMQLKQQGMSDQEISDSLQQQGIAPKQITDAINQARIKNAVSADASELPPAPTQTGEQQGGAVDAGQYYSPQTQGPEGGAQPEYYEEAGYQPSAGGYGMDSDTIIELASQVVSEKTKKSDKQLSELTEFKSLMQVKVDNVEERLKRIEKMIDTLQIKILEKVGSYSGDLEKTKKEVSMLEDSMEKIAKATGTKKSSTRKKSSKKK